MSGYGFQIQMEFHFLNGIIMKIKLLLLLLLLSCSQKHLNNKIYDYKNNYWTNDLDEIIPQTTFYNVINLDEVNIEFEMASYDTLPYSFIQSNIIPESFQLYDYNNSIIDNQFYNINFLKGEMIKRGSILVDVGINRVDADNEREYDIVGDVDWDSVISKVSAITPVPGGVGPMTIAMLVENTVEAAENIG